MGPFVVQGEQAENVKPRMCVACQAKGPFQVSGRRSEAHDALQRWMFWLGHL
jgi:hypothetical protein